MKKRTLNYYLVALFFAFIYTNVNYHFGDNNHQGLLPYLYSRLDNSYLIRDFFANYTRLVDARYYYNLLILQILKVVPIEILFYILTLLSNFLIFLVTLKTVFLFNKNRLIPILSIILMTLFAKFGNLGGAGAVVDSYLLPQLLSMPIILFSFYFILSGKFNIGYFLSIVALFVHPSVTLVGLIPLAVGVIFSKKISKKYAKLFLLLSSHVVLTYFFFIRYSNCHILSDKYYIYVLAYFRHPHHYIPSAWPFNEYFNFFYLILGIFVSLYLLKDKSRINLKVMFVSVVGSLLLMLLGYVFVEIIPVREIVELQTFRIVYFVRWVFYVTLPLGIYKLLFRIKARRYINIFFMLAIFIGIFFLTRYKVEKIFSPNIYFLENTQRIEIFEYIGENTSKTSLFLAPPYFGDLRLYPQRALVIDLKTFPFREDYMEEWYHRVRDVYGDSREEGFDAVYKLISDEKIVALKEKYHFDYVILYSSTPTKLNIVYRDFLYKLVKM